MYLAQLRNSLAEGNVAEAKHTCIQLCGQRIPEGVEFPADNTDWTTTMYDELEIGNPDTQSKLCI